MLKGMINATPGQDRQPAAGPVDRGKMPTHTITIRLPWWKHERLKREARKLGVDLDDRVSMNRLSICKLAAPPPTGLCPYGEDCRLWLTPRCDPWCEYDHESNG